MIDKEKAGNVRLLEHEDFSRVSYHKDAEKNPKSLVGWQPASQGEGSLANLMGFALMRVIVQKVIDGKLEDLYDQPILVENTGAVVVPVVGDKIGLIQNYRFVGERIQTADPSYVKSLNDEQKWGELAAALGAWRWELPAGISPLQGGKSLEEVVLAAAKLEASEEAGFVIVNARIIGKVNFNPTFFAHAQYVVMGEIASRGEQSIEDEEIIGGVNLFSPAEIRGLIEDGDLDDGRSLSSLALAGIAIPA